MAINLKTDPISKSFYQYLWPALTGMVIKSLFIMGDAFFIGMGVGPDGLGAISLIIPPFSIFTAIAMMVGIGGAAKMSIEIGKGNTDSSQLWFSQSMLLTAILSTITVVAALTWLDELIAFMGASGNMAQLAHDYLGVLLPFFVLYSLAWVLSCFVRNDANPKLATYAMSLGAIANLFFDYIFIIEMGMGMKGAAYATAISQVVIAVILLSHFARKKGSLELSLKGIGLDKTKEIISIGGSNLLYRSDVCHDHRFVQLCVANTVRREPYHRLWLNHQRWRSCSVCHGRHRTSVSANHQL